MIEYIYNGEIVNIAFTDAEFHYIRVGSNSKYYKKIYIQELPIYHGPPEKYRIKLANLAPGWHNPWRPEGFFSQELGGKTYYCYKPHRVPLGNNNDLIVVSKANRRITSTDVLEAIADARGFARGDIVRYKATLGNRVEISTWRSNRQQFEASMGKLLAPGATCEILWDGKFKFEKVD